MNVVVGVTGNTGEATARALLARGAPLRAVVRDPSKAAAWASRGAEIAVADLADTDSLSRAFAGAESAYVLNPPAYTAPDLFATAEALAASILEAVRKSGIERLVVLSSIGAHLPSGSGNIRTNRAFERILGVLDRRVTFLRPAYFMENWAWVAAAAANEGVLPSFLAPPDRAIPMASTADIGRVAAGAMLDGGNGARVIELAGPRHCSPDDAAAAFTKELGRPVKALPVPREQWPAVLEGMRFSARTIESWLELFDGFNSGWIAFERPGAAVLRGSVSLEEAIGAVVRGTTPDALSPERERA
jgi:uncharacterized protein YbjT (DUF2867 family)